MQIDNRKRTITWRAYSQLIATSCWIFGSIAFPFNAITTICRDKDIFYLTEAKNKNFQKSQMYLFTSGTVRNCISVDDVSDQVGKKYACQGYHDMAKFQLYTQRLLCLNMFSLKLIPGNYFRQMKRSSRKTEEYIINKQSNEFS